MARICMITTEHTPDDDRIFHKEAKSLLKAGHELFILCVADAEGRIWSMGKREVLNPDGSLTLELEGVQVYAVKGPANYMEVTLKKFFSGGFLKRFVKTGKSFNADVYHAHEPVSFYLAYQMAEGRSEKIVFDSHESWVGGTPRERWVKRFYLSKLQYLITANSITRGHLLALNPHMETREIRNYPQAEVFNKPFKEGSPERPVIVHDGILPFNRGLKEMVEAINQVCKKHPQATLRILGEVQGSERSFLESRIKEYGLSENIAITGWVPYDKVPDYLQDCSIGLILKRPHPINNLLGGPAIKLFNYFASGLAVIDAGLHESTRFLDKTGSGISLWDKSPEGIAEAICYLLENPELLRTYCHRSWEASKSMTWEKEAEKLIDFYNNTILSRSPSFKIR